MSWQTLRTLAATPADAIEDETLDAQLTALSVELDASVKLAEISHIGLELGGTGSPTKIIFTTLAKVDDRWVVFSEREVVVADSYGGAGQGESDVWRVEPYASRLALLIAFEGHNEETETPHLTGTISVRALSYWRDVEQQA
jgi:hypothetical protein